ncbi:myelin transcription factor 1-like protein isoform X2 [Silurus meridionalis]|uniref:myelin transcription factor 1-like protein isoform X2 n=1 Tax=Silurus meridionalis TaxID=175797 RepID=UPI001EEC293C|nr:myelin transcription factor 1-like protein isoform X2 [Silurus meridionalis]
MWVLTVTILLLCVAAHAAEDDSEKSSQENITSDRDGKHDRNKTDGDGGSQSSSHSDSDESSKKNIKPDRDGKHDRNKTDDQDETETDDQDETETDEHEQDKTETYEEHEQNNRGFSSRLLILVVVLACMGLFVVILWNSLTQYSKPNNNEHHYETIDDTVPPTAAGSGMLCKTVYALADNPEKLNQDTTNPRAAFCSTSDTLWRINPVYPRSHKKQTHIQII